MCVHADSCCRCSFGQQVERFFKPSDPTQWAFTNEGRVGKEGWVSDKPVRRRRTSPVYHCTACNLATAAPGGVGGVLQRVSNCRTRRQWVFGLKGGQQSIWDE